MKIVISQPMKGLSNEEIRKNREKVVKMLTEQGHEVIDSVFDYEDVPDIKNKPLYYLAKSIELIANEADAVYFMEGWQEARGCTAEHYVCRHYNVLKLYESPSFQD